MKCFNKLKADYAVLLSFISCMFFGIFSILYFYYPRVAAEVAETEKSIKSGNTKHYKKILLAAPEYRKLYTLYLHACTIPP